METGNIRTTKLRNYLMAIIGQIDENYKQVNVNYLSKDPSNYSLDKIPVEKEAESWIIGNVINRDVYSFRSRMNYSAEVISNITNVGFFETFERIIKANNEQGELPDIPGIESIRCLNCVTFLAANSTTAEFDIQIEIRYRDTGEEIQPSL